MLAVLRFVAILGMLSAAHAHPAWAGVTIEQISLSDGKAILLVKGEFALSDDPTSLTQAVMSSGAKIVTFDSDGGNVAAAMRFGKAIRSAGLDTVQLRARQCASACALAFVGGSKRTAEPGSIGVHQSSFSADAGLDSSSAVAAVQAMTANIMAYLMEMGVDPRLLQLSLSTASEDMRYLTSSEMAQYGVTGGQSSAIAFVRPVPPPPALPATQQPTGPAPPVADARSRALDFTARYHVAWSKPNGSALAFMATAYADTVDFYGKPSSLQDVLNEKKAFSDRWPQRAYSVRSGTERIVCATNCTVSAVVEWFAQSVGRGKTSSGAAEFTFTWNPGTGKIESETSKVVETDRAAKAPQRIISQWQRQNDDCRGGRGDSDETWKACDRREVIGTKLEAVGWCYGREGEVGYQNDWHVCGR